MMKEYCVLGKNENTMQEKARRQGNRWRNNSSKTNSCGHALNARTWGTS